VNGVRGEQDYASRKKRAQKKRKGQFVEREGRLLEEEARKEYGSTSSKDSHIIGGVKETLQPT